MTKQNKDGWIRHRGGKCPVDAGSIIDVRYRKAEPGVAGFSPSGKRADYYYWAHDAGKGDIIAYKLHKPAEQVEACSKPDPRDSAKRDSDYVCWMRDRIT